MKKIAILFLIVTSLLLFGCAQENTVVEEEQSNVEKFDNSEDFFGTWYDIEDTAITLTLKENYEYIRGDEQGTYEMFFGGNVSSDYKVVNSIELISFDGEKTELLVHDTKYGYGLGGSSTNSITMDLTNGVLYLKSKKDAKSYLADQQEKLKPTEKSLIGKWYSYYDDMDYKFKLSVNSDNTYEVKDGDDNIIEYGNWSYSDSTIYTEITKTSKSDGSYVSEKKLSYDMDDGWRLTGGDTTWGWLKR